MHGCGGLETDEGQTSDSECAIYTQSSTPATQSSSNTRPELFRIESAISTLVSRTNNYEMEETSYFKITRSLKVIPNNSALATRYFHGLIFLWPSYFAAVMIDRHDHYPCQHFSSKPLADES